MKRQSSLRMTIVWMGIVAGILAGGMDAAKADFTLGEPTNLGARVNSPENEFGGIISEDGLALHFSSNRPGGYGGLDIWVSTRARVGEEWDIPTNVGPLVNSSELDVVTSLSRDGLEMYLQSTRTGGHGRTDLYVSTRPSKDAPWAPPVSLGATINTSSYDEMAVISPDGLALLFHSNRSGSAGGCDIYVTTRLARSDPWGPPTNLGPTFNSLKDDFCGCLSPDGLRLFLASDRPGGFGGLDTWMAARPSKDLPWTTPVNLGRSLNTAHSEFPSSVSPDGLLLYLDDMSNLTAPRPGGSGSGDLWQAHIIPIVDFNGDGEVDGFEIRRMADSWGTDDSLCDIGPMPWGDGIVDVEDLKVLARHIGQEVDDPTLIAHWALDETDGIVAKDGAGNHDGTVTGIPAWQPAGGKQEGCLQFHGTSFVATGRVLNPSEAPFSVLAWVKGGAPGQVIISQEAGANWLLLDPLTGLLMTELKSRSRSGKALYSDVIIDGTKWHRVAFTWDGTHRRLYVDDGLVAEDTQGKLADSSGNVIIGAGSTLAPGTYWTGLIDDVRIYNRVVRP
ncbi:MAG: hypothetical protein FJ280_06965 [Planctomycetes bacterium]|nr:hypothetical protein [Planctomycetota bacterium]